MEKKWHLGEFASASYLATLGGTSIFHMGKRKVIFK